MNWTLEVVVVPVSDVDRSKAFYSDQVGFDVDFDTRVSDDLRFVQLTPPGSGCSIVIGTGVSQMTPGSLKGLQLVVPDIRQAHAELSGRGVKVTDVQVYDGDASRLERGRGGSGQRRVCLLRRPRWKRMGGAADLVAGMRAGGSSVIPRSRARAAP